jgi:hypothetical protein
VWGNPVNARDFDSFSDVQLVEYFREASLEHAKFGFNAVKGNHVVDEKLTPAYEALKARGQRAMQDFLALTDDPDPNVRADSAIFGYDTEPGRCRDALKKLIGEPGLPGAFAVVWLIDRDPDFRAEFREMGRQDAEHFLRELDRRYPPKKED